MQPTSTKIISEEEAKRLVAGDLGKASLEAISSYAAPLFWTDRDADNRTLFRNGSTFFVTGIAMSYGVTADHVVQACLEAASQLSNFYCGIGPTG